MTVISENKRSQYTITEAQVVFPYTFRILNQEHLLVIYADSAGNETELELTTNYTIDGVGDAGGGNVTTCGDDSPYPTESTITIIRDVPLTQLIDYVENDMFPAETHERGLDKATMLLQQFSEELDRFVGLPVSSALKNLIIPIVGSKVIGWDALGESLTTYPVTPVLDPSWDSIQNYDNDLATAVAEIGGAAKTLLIDVATESVTVNLEVPKTLELYPTRTGLITIDNCILTINKLSIATGTYKIFNCINGGSVVLVSGAVKEPYPEWWENNAIPGTTDMTAAIHAAFTAAKSIGMTVCMPAEEYRVTSGFDQLVDYHDLTIRGMGASRENVNDQATIITLDNVSVDSYFYKQGARHNLVVENIVFKCKQEVQDRKFFRFTAELARFIFRNVNFESVEKPLVFEAGCYFQSASLHDVQFRNSGTIHSETSELVGTLLLLNNVNHDGSVPANTDKIVCDLSGIRQIQGINFLLEGVCPAADWTVLKLDESVHDPEYARFPIASFHGFWSEWAAPVPIYVVDQVAGRTLFSSTSMHLTPTSQFKLSSSAQVAIEKISLAGVANNFVDLFNIEDFKCHVILRECAFRDTGSLTTLGEYFDERFTIVDCNIPRSAAAEDEILASTVFSNTQSSLVYKWDGGYLDGEAAILGLYGGTTSQLDTDATYGRQLTIIPNANVINATIEAKLRGTLAQYKQVIVVATFKLPTFTAGSILLRALEDGVPVGNLALYDAATYSAQITRVIMPFRPKTAFTDDIGITLVASGTEGVAGNLELYAFAIYAGNAAPRVEYPSYPKNIITWAAAAPIAGSFIQGDIVWNNAPAASGTPGWVCTTGGTPGTWKAMANIAA